jgi:fibronectin type 3 domain-containing protein
MKTFNLLVAAILICSCTIPADLGERKNQDIPVPGAVTVQIISLNSVTISWNPVSGAASYSVFRSVTGEDDSFTRVKVTQETSWTDTSLITGTTYYYQVSTALNNAGEGGRSAAVSVCPMLPPAPENVRAETISANSILVSWDASSQADSYRIYRADSAGGAYNALPGVANNTLSYMDTSVAAGNEYFYKVAGVSVLGESELSSYTSAVTKVPVVPVGVTAAALSDSQIAVSWNAVSGASAYKLYRSESAVGTFDLLTTITAPNVRYIDASLAPVTECFYTVSAVNIIGESEKSDVVSAVTHIPPPDTIHAVPASASSIDVTWSQVIWANSYKLYRSTNENDSYEHIATTAELSYLDAVSDNTLKYFYKVSAVSAAGESVLSVYASAEFKFPDAPSGLSAVSLSSTSLEISWDSVQGASGYKLYHSNTTATGTYNLIATVDDTNYTHSGLTINTDYWYKVSALNIIGEGEQSAYINARIAPPATPANVRVTPLSDTSLRVSWDPVPGALLYSVYRNVGERNEYSVNVYSSNMITSTTDTYYIDTGLDPFRRYYYKVSATNEIGTGALTATAVSTYTRPIPLEEGVWYSRTTSVSYTYSSSSSYHYDYYSFPVSGGNYFIQWGNVGHTQETSYGFSAYWSSTNSMTNLSTAYFTAQTGGLANPRRIQPPNSGYIIIRVSRSGSSSIYDLRFYRE